MIRLSFMEIWHWISHFSQALWVLKRMDGRVSRHKSKGEKKMNHTIERTEMKDHGASQSEVRRDRQLSFQWLSSTQPVPHEALSRSLVLRGTLVVLCLFLAYPSLNEFLELLIKSPLKRQ